MNARRVNSAYSDLLDDIRPAEIARISEQIKLMEGSDAWGLLTRLLNGRRDKLVARLTAEGALSHEQMTRLAGEIRALAAWQEAADTVLVLAEENERALQAAESA